MVKQKILYNFQKISCICLLISLNFLHGWDVKNAHDYPITGISFNSTGEYIYTVDNTGVQKKWTYSGVEVESSSQDCSFEKCEESSFLARNHDGSLLLVYDDNDCFVHVIDQVSHQELISYYCKGPLQPCGAFSINNYIALTGGGSSFYVLDFEFEKVNGCMKIIDKGIPFDIASLAQQS